MSYTQLDWLGDQVRESMAFNREAYKELVNWMREDGKAIVRAVEHEALIHHIVKRPHDHDLCTLAIDRWAKDARDWDR